ncbi:VIT1/CCC1 family predicted Fe2+/Mn2+ transporter [Luteibacter rhizovicinus]|uniref:VIT1/CCC1 family predicted Fe2+/Mn2+ transporter n=1 Tax=Luteibacter rhizovicinus TaxID=242606 RepID=A0A4R3YW81_9GAMM|nr:VIT1/CCC1 transporter family protein [Luteibacter rhizovicinus]TCV96078.1 VIT1/CCC1 family predicted Fe2+/Mn2+ transporter [Luteibacter rhizovicinus]
MRRHREKHRTGRIAWLRAAVLGANDGILSTASLMIGVAAAESGASNVLIAGVAGLVAGAMSMGAGEYVSVYSQADSERAELALESWELENDPTGEHRELTEIYVMRGLDRDLANTVADQLMKHDALQAHARDELGLSDTTAARPLQAAAASATSFATGALLPLLAAWLAPDGYLAVGVVGVSLLALLGLGALSARLGGASMLRGATRIGFWGAAAMAATSAVGALFGIA